MFNDVFYVNDFANVNPKDKVDFLVDVGYNITKVEYELSAASDKFDRALFGGTAKVNVANKDNKIVYQKSYDIVGDYAYTGVGVSGRDKLSQKWSFKSEPLWGWSC